MKIVVGRKKGYTLSPIEFHHQADPRRKVVWAMFMERKLFHRFEMIKPHV